MPEEDAYNLLKELRGTKKTETESKAEAERRVLQAADISGDGKSVVYYGLMATDKEQGADGRTGRQRRRHGRGDAGAAGC